MYICVFATGRPIGITTSPTSSGHFHHVTSTAASVGPYRLCNSAHGISSRHRRATTPDNASPLHRIRFTLPHRPTSPCSRKIPSIEGTKCTVVIPYLSIAALRYPGSLCPPGRAITNRAPTSNGQKNSHTDTSKLYGVFCNTASPPLIPYALCIHSRRFTMLRCSIIAPLGTPVDPDV